MERQPLLLLKPISIQKQPVRIEGHILGKLSRKWSASMEDWIFWFLMLELMPIFTLVISKKSRYMRRSWRPTSMPMFIWPSMLYPIFVSQQAILLWFLRFLGSLACRIVLPTVHPNLPWQVSLKVSAPRNKKYRYRLFTPQAWTPQWETMIYLGQSMHLKLPKTSNSQHKKRQK